MRLRAPLRTRLLWLPPQEGCGEGVAYAQIGANGGTYLGRPDRTLCFTLDTRVHSSQIFPAIVLPGIHPFAGYRSHGTFLRKEPSKEELGELVSSSSPAGSHPSTIRDDWQMQTKCRRCALCDGAIMPAQERFKPCKCETAEVHTLCSINDERWLSRRCMVCGEIWQKPFQPSSTYINGSLTYDPYNCEKLCFICGKSSVSFQSRPRRDAQMIRPCFCDISCHHGCMVDRLQLSRQCSVCGASYRFIEYGSLRDFFVRYWCQYTCSVIILLILFGSAALAMAKALGDINNFSLTNLFILIIGVALFGLCLVFLWKCIKYTIMRRIPRFHTRYRQFTVFDYEPTVIDATQMRRNRFEGTKRANLKPATSLEQCLLNSDFSSSRQMASTPIAGPSSQVLFSFDTAEVKKSRGG
ncbi:hypothetical protein Y032_0661g1280 [Ancylostoma ceylanicum]|uniref:Uncharacterized protein n=1 Tax=Ancylostoma ceylanicum TaxID=53326 RepID=A0A016WHQ6_9BILA|nr:hypothetical protein Y032_0661g1280 [Ancylostoma ceylanicum]